MAFPSVSTAVTDGTTAATSADLNLPGGSIGDLLVVVLRVAVTGSIGGMSGWVELVNTSDSSGDQIGLYYKYRSASDGSTVNATFTNGKYASVAAALSGSGSEVVVSRDSTYAQFTTGSGDGTQPSCPAFTPGGSGVDSVALDHLWGAFVNLSGEPTVPPSYPTNYTLGNASASSGSGGSAASNVRAACAFRELNTAGGETPGAYTYGGSWSVWRAWTMRFYLRPKRLPTPNMSGQRRRLTT